MGRKYLTILTKIMGTLLIFHIFSVFLLQLFFSNCTRFLLSYHNIICFSSAIYVEDFDVMLFNTMQYILFLPAAALIYYLLPQKVRYLWLLAVSYYFYMQWNPVYILLLFSCTLLTYVSGRIIEKLQDSAAKLADDEIKLHDVRKKKRICFVICLLLNLCVLGYFKYFDFTLYHLNSILQHINLKEISRSHDIILPVGISFYTLQALGYLIDVYRGDIYAEKNFLRYALFVSFFPQLVAGPIERSKNLLVQLKESHRFEYENLRKGLLLVLYGMFLKMVIADRAAIIVDTVYKDSSVYPGFYIAVATCFFAIQIYCDFHGYSTIARGSALLIGIRLMDNFEAPYYSKNVKEFWRRWHISLSGWFRDYLYIPLGGNRKGQARKECNLLVVFGVSGLWHGASLSYVFWGLLNGAYQVIADIVRVTRRFAVNLINKFISIGSHDAIVPVKCYTAIGPEIAARFSRRLFETVTTFFMITFAWLFFRAGTLRNSYAVIKNMLSVNNWTVLFDGSLYGLGVARNYMNILMVSILALFIVDYHKYKGKDVAEIFLRQGWWFRVMGIMLMLFTILLYGCYGEMYDIQQFIYFQF